MKKFIMMAAAILFTISASAQYMPQIQFGYNGPNGCQPDFEVKLYCNDVGTGINVGETEWFAAPNSGMQYDYSDISILQTWSNDPGAASATNDWEFYAVDIRVLPSCGTVGTGTVGPPCGSGNLNGCSVDPINSSSCFEYDVSSSCTTCPNMLQIDCTFTGGQIATFTTGEL